MKTKSIILPAIAWLVILTSAGALTFASSGQSYSWARQWNMWMRNWWMRNSWESIKNLSETDRQAMMDTVQKAIDAKDYNAFKAAHTKYWVDLNITETQFKEMIAKRTEMETKRAQKETEKNKIQEAIKNWDFDTRKKLNTNKPILNYIDTQAKFTKLQEIQSYREKIQNIAQELWLPQWKSMWEWIGMSKWKWMGMGLWQNK